MTTLIQLKINIPIIEEKIGYKFTDKALLELAFIHRSFANENRFIMKDHNERLEFLGDAILGLIISDFLYLTLPNHPEGELSYLRSRLVEASSCARYVQKLSLERFLLMGKGESMNEGKGRSTILSDLFEALIGAIYLDGGIKSSKDFFFDHFKEDVFQTIEKPHRNWKAELQDYCQKNYQRPPEYIVLKEEGPDHLKVFLICVKLGEKELGRGKGSSKKEAEQDAAQSAVKTLKL